MTPRRLDVDMVDARLRTMEPLVARLAELRDVTGRELSHDLDLRLVVERILTLLVEVAVSVNSHVVAASGSPLPPDYRSSFGAAAQVGLISEELARRVSPSAGLRNLLTHRYGDVDHQRVADAVPTAVDDYTDYLAQVSRWLLDAEDAPGPVPPR